MIDCADSTRLRTHLDHPDSAVDAHLEDCEACAGLLRSVAADAGFAHRALCLLDPPGEPHLSEAEVDAALQALLSRHAPAAVVPPAPPQPGRRAAPRRRAALAAAAALVVLVVALTPPGRSAVAQALDAFRGERLQPVAVDLAQWAEATDPEDLRQLAALGRLDLSGVSDPEQVADRAEAGALAGIRPPNLAEAPDRLLALAPGTIRLELARRDGNGVPAELDGAVLVVEVPGAIGAVYGRSGDLPDVVVGRSAPLVVRAEGAPLEDVREFLLGREELPEDLRAQLAAIDDWRSTIPVPVPIDGPGWKELEVAGRPAIAFGDGSGLGSVVLRQDPDGITVVGGFVDIDRALDLAGAA